MSNFEVPVLFYFHCLP